MALQRRALGALLLLWAAAVAALPATPVIPYAVVARYEHRSGAFTQGLELAGDTLYESSGLYHQSYIARWKPGADGLVERHDLPGAYFGEGLTVVGERIFVLTWKAGRGLILDRATLHEVGRFRYPGEGWGLTHDAHRLIMSDGSATLRFLDPATQRQLDTVTVTERGRAVEQLNELEWVQRRVLANIWLTDGIVVINPKNGHVTARLDLSGLYPPGTRSPHADVLNGIALDPADGTLLVTGKFWPAIYRLKLLRPLP